MTVPAGRAAHGTDAPRSGHTDMHYLPVVEPAESAAAEIRRATIGRMLTMSRLHAEAAWLRRRSDQLSPHAIAMLYSQPDTQPAALYPFRVTAATKVWFAGDGARQLSDHLHRFWDALTRAGEVTADGFDIRALCNKRDEAMDDHAEYVGLGVSTLDTYTGDWEQAVSCATRHEDIAGCVRIVLTDGTLIAVERRAMAEFKAVNIYATGSIDYAPGHTPYAWTRATPEHLYGEAQHAQVFRFMTGLNDAFWQMDRCRHIARRVQKARR